MSDVERLQHAQRLGRVEEDLGFGREHVAGHKQEPRSIVRPGLTQLLAELRPAQPRHLQIGDDQVVVVLAALGQGFFPGAGRVNVERLVFEYGQLLLTTWLGRTVLLPPALG